MMVNYIIKTFELSLFTIMLSGGCAGTKVNDRVDIAKQYIQQDSLPVGKQSLQISELFSVDYRGVETSTFQEIRDRVSINCPVCDIEDTGYSFVHAWTIKGLSDARDHELTLLFFGWELPGIPSASRAIVMLTDTDWNKLWSQKISIGSRIELENASLDSVSDYDIDVPLLIVHSSPTVLSPDVALQYYAISSDRLALIRIESTNGEITRNNYWNGAADLGTIPLKRTDSAIFDILATGSKIDQLEMLVWLGGEHFRASPDGSLSEERLPIVNSPKLVSVLSQLRKTSQNPWIIRSIDLVLSSAAGP